jgi:hypothetical protein
VETDPVDFVEFLLADVQTRDLDHIAEDIVDFAVKIDDLRQHVVDRLKPLKEFADSKHPTPAANPRLVAQNIVNAIRAIVSGRLARGSGR